MAKQKVNSLQLAECFAHIVNSTSQSLPASSGTTLTFPTVTRNNGMTVSTTTITVPTDGIYLVTANVQLDANSIRADLTFTGVSGSAAINQAFGKLSASITQFVTSGTAISVQITNNNATANTNSAHFTVIRLAS